MTKQPHDMTGVPPAKQIRFSCQRYDEQSVTKEMIIHLIDLAKCELQKIAPAFPPHDLEGVIEILGNYKAHDFEGRAERHSKETLATTEIINALSFQDQIMKLGYLVFRYRFSVYPARKIVSNFPIIVAIEPTSICNLRCIMCFQADEEYFRKGPHMGFMDMELYRRLVDEISENQPSGIVLASRGEPLLHKNFTEMVRYATQKGVIDVKVNTNCTRLNEKAARELLEAEPNTLVFSVDAGDKKEFEAIRVGANFDQIVGNIKKFNEIRSKEFPNSKTRTRVSMTIFRETQDAEQARKLWEPLVDEFAVHSADYRLDIYQHPPLPQETRPCGLLWERLYVWWDGSVNPCDTDYKSCLSPGKISQGQSIKSIWLGEKMQAMRRNHQAGQKSLHFPCNQCYGS